MVAFIFKCWNAERGVFDLLRQSFHSYPRNLRIFFTSRRSLAESFWKIVSTGTDTYNCDIVHFILAGQVTFFHKNVGGENLGLGSR